MRKQGTGDRGQGTGYDTANLGRVYTVLRPTTNDQRPTSFPFPVPRPLSPFLVLSFCLLFLLGCSWSPPPQFKLNTEGRDPLSIGGSQRESIAETLEKLFGTPDIPLVPEGIDLNKELLAVAAGPVGSDENDNPRGLFRKHCVA
jgi:hypothetical protein